jgi:2'-5' RNA ligase
VSEQHPRFAFPEHLPPSLSDPAVIAAHDWSAFCEVDVLTNHWDRPGWPPGRCSYHWFIALDDQPALIDLAQRCQHALAAFGLDPVAPEFLHLTLCRVGFTDEVTEEQARSVAEAARQQVGGPGSLRLTVGPLAGSPGAVRFSVSPWEPLLELHDRLIETRAAVFASPAGTSRFRPHVGIAYGNRTMPASPLRQAMEPLRRLSAVQVTAGAAHLVILRREDHAYQWERFETLCLTRQTL